MIIKENQVNVEVINTEDILVVDNKNIQYKEAIFFDLEHYVYKKPKCVGVFGSCYYDENKSKLIVTQYMIENGDEGKDILFMGERYFKELQEKHNKKYIVTFSGNNDFTVINYLFPQYGIEYKILDNYKHIDLQREYEKVMKHGIGLKALEKAFEIEREGELIAGSNLAKTFHKVMKDKEYIYRMPKEKIEKILQYNEQDVVNLFHIYVQWNKYINLLKIQMEEEAKAFEEARVKEEALAIENAKLESADAENSSEATI